MLITIESTQRICNGLSSNCRMRANEITYPSSHNVMSSTEDDFIFPNNIKSMEKALEGGIRGLLLDSCDCGMDDGIQFCHGECFLGTKDPTQTFDAIVEFLNTNPNEVLILEIQVDDDTLLGLWEYTSDEFRSMVYNGRKNFFDSWPTLNDMIDLNQRMIVFQHGGDNSPDTNCALLGDCPDGVYNFYDYGFQTPWDLKEDELNDYERSCRVFVGRESADDFIMNNHYAKELVPEEDIAKQINSLSNLQDRMKICSENVWRGRNTSLLVVDFWSIGDVVKAANEQNLALSGGNTPSLEPTPEPSTDSTPVGCFSGNSMIVVSKKQNGDFGTPIAMKDLRLGDLVLVDQNRYEKVYSFAHYHTTIETEYIQLLPSQLEMTPQHLVFVQGYQEPIPASSVRVGDVLVGSTQVTKIRVILCQGMYAPLTPSGTIVVNGAMASNYITLKSTKHFFQVGSTLLISHHAISHFFVTLIYRLTWNKKEQYTTDGINLHLDTAYKVFSWIVNGNFFLLISVITIVITFSFVVATILLTIREKGKIL